MKRIFYISFIAVAVFLLQAIAVLPHHHHDEMACMAKAHCLHACDCADGEEHNHDADNHHSHNGTQRCVAESEYLVSNNNNENECELSCDGHSHLHLSVALLVLNNFYACYAEPSAILHKYRKRIVSYKSVDAGQSVGLRAPPCYQS